MKVMSRGCRARSRSGHQRRRLFIVAAADTVMKRPTCDLMAESSRIFRFAASSPSTARSSRSTRRAGSSATRRSSPGASSSSGIAEGRAALARRAHRPLRHKRLRADDGDRRLRRRRAARAVGDDAELEVSLPSRARQIRVRHQSDGGECPYWEPGHLDENSRRTRRRPRPRARNRTCVLAASAGSWRDPSGRARPSRGRTTLSCAPSGRGSAAAPRRSCSAAACRRTSARGCGRRSRKGTSRARSSTAT